MQKQNRVGVLLLYSLFVLASCTQGKVEEEKKINQLLDHFHKAADQGDKTLYLNSFMKDGVFMGTDDWERWSLPEFTKYVNARFKEGKGWSYKPVERHIMFSKNKKTAWFDEIITSEKWGRFRGTGVLEKRHKDWKIAHYSMSFLIPNAVWKESAELAKAGYTKRKQEQPSTP